MPNRARSLVILLLLSAASACGPKPAELESRAVAALRSEVPALQEAHRARHGRYATHIRELTGGADTLASGVRIIINGADASGWSATSSVPDVVGPACATWIGDPPVRPMLRGSVGPKQAGQVACIAFEPWMKRGVIEQSGPFAIAP